MYMCWLFTMISLICLHQNRMDESLILFESVINSRWFLWTPIILFLNKIDVFKVKLPKVIFLSWPFFHLCFPDIHGRCH